MISDIFILIRVLYGCDNGTIHFPLFECSIVQKTAGQLQPVTVAWVISIGLCFASSRSDMLSHDDVNWSRLDQEYLMYP